MNQPRSYNRVCLRCKNKFTAKSGAATVCSECRKCKECGGLCRLAHHMFCSHTCAARFNSRNGINGGCFKAGERRLLKKTCTRCSKQFEANSPTRLVCPDCCKCRECGKQLPNASHPFCGNSCAGKWKYRNSEKVREAMAIGQKVPKKSWGATKGRPNHKMRGEGNHNWKGGCKHKRDHRHQEMQRVEYKLWRASVFKRDDYTCATCKQHGGSLRAHHIHRWEEHPDLRYDVTNGVTLCRECHHAITGKENLFVDRFTAFVASKTPVALTGDEVAAFEPFHPPCSDCGSVLTRKRHQRGKKFYFCNLACKKAFQSRFNNNWLTACHQTS